MENIFLPTAESPSSGSPSSLPSSDDEDADASSGAEDETLEHARERLRQARAAAIESTKKDDDDDDILEEDAVPMGSKRRRLKRAYPASDADGDRENSSDASSQSEDEDEDEDEGEDAEESDEDPYVRLGLKKKLPPAPLLSEAAAHGAVWAYCSEHLAQKRPSWSTAHLSCDAAEAEQRNNDKSLATIESELTLSKHETHAPPKPPPAPAVPIAPALGAEPAPTEASAAEPGLEPFSIAKPPRAPPPPSSVAAVRAHASAPHDGTTPVFTAAPARRHAAHLPASASAVRIGAGISRHGTPASAASGGLTRLMKGRFPARTELNPSIRGATVRQMPSVPQPLRDATGSAGLQALAQRHGWRMVTSTSAQRPVERVEKSRRQFLAATSSAE